MINPVCCWVLRGEALRTPPGPEGSNGKELPSGVAGKPSSTPAYQSPLAFMEASSGTKPARSLATRSYWLAVPAALSLLSLLSLGYLTSFTPVTVIDGEDVLRVRTRQTTVAGVLREAGITLMPEDIVRPDLDAPLNHNDAIIVQRARTVQVSVDGEMPRWVRTQRAYGAEVLQDLGYTLSVNDAIVVEGRTDDSLPSTPRPAAPTVATQPPRQFDGRRYPLSAGRAGHHSGGWRPSAEH